ncbi:PEGA domain-containing protein [bacterium]|nr:PEGA domain-containing protein [bacterium]
MRASLPSILFASSLLGGLAALGVAFESRPEPSQGQLRILSEPSGATVLLDNREVGKTPLIQTPSSGKHTVKLKLDGFIPEESGISYREGESQSLHLRLKPLAGTLVIKDLDKARVHLGPGIPQELEGKGPWKLAPGNYEITAVRGPIPARPRRIEIKAGQNLEVALDWPALPVVPPPLPAVLPPSGQISTPPPPPISSYAPRPPAYVAPRYNQYQPPRPVYRPSQPLFTPIPPSHDEPPPPPPPRSYPGGGEPIFTPLP